MGNEANGIDSAKCTFWMCLANAEFNVKVYSVSATGHVQKKRGPLVDTKLCKRHTEANEDLIHSATPIEGEAHTLPCGCPVDLPEVHQEGCGFDRAMNTWYPQS